MLEFFCVLLDIRYSELAVCVAMLPDLLDFWMFGAAIFSTPGKAYTWSGACHQRPGFLFRISLWRFLRLDAWSDRRWYV